MNPTALLILDLLLSSCIPGGGEPPTLELVSVRRIWDKAPHNAFTGLIRHRDRFFCVFREGAGHVSPDGKIRVLASADGESWESTALIAQEGKDLRDPKVCAAPDGRLMVVGAAAVREGTRSASSHRSFAIFSEDGREWSGLESIAEPDRWLWRVTWNRGKAYGISYDTGGRAARTYGTALHSSDDGVKFSLLVPKLQSEGGPTEGTLRFAEDGTAYCLQRRDGSPNTALLGSSKPPYTEWTWKDLGQRLGGPDFIPVPGKRWLAGGRMHPGGAHTAICDLDVEKGKLTPLLKLPSGGDNSYPGLLWHDDLLWISYYSSHEGKTSIYLARVKLKAND